MKKKYVLLKSLALIMRPGKQLYSKSHLCKALPAFITQFIFKNKKKRAQEQKKYWWQITDKPCNV